jgi:hypothetical protein
MDTSTPLDRKAQLLKRIEEDRRRLRAIESREKETERKARTRKLIQIGAEVARVLGDDPGFVAFYFRGASPENIQSKRAAYEAEIAIEREAEKKSSEVQSSTPFDVEPLSVEVAEPKGIFSAFRPS